MATTLCQSNLPLPRHGALMTALLAPGPVACPAALHWLETVDFDTIDIQEERFMPFFDSRMRELAIDHPNQGRVRGLYRRAWYREQKMRRGLSKIFQIVEETETKVILLKGAALSRMVYDHPAHRPYGDLDILVPWEQQLKVLRGLRRAGGVVSGKSYHAITVRMPSGIYVDLHRSPYHLAFLARHVEPLFTRLLEVKKDHSKSVAESSGMLLTLGNADQLLHTIMHGLCSHEQAIRWIVDAVLLVRQERERIDWDLFHDETVRLEFIEPTIIGLREILSYEPDKDAARVLAQLERQSPPSAVEQWLRDRRLPAIITLWDQTRRNARGPARLALVAKLLIEQHGIVGFAYKATTKGWSYYLKIIRVLHERYKRRASSEDV